MKKTSKLKIIFSSYDDLKNPYYAGGGALAIHEIAKRLAVKCEVVVITGKYPGSKDEKIDGVMYRRIGTSFLGAKLDQLTFQICLPILVLTEKYDVWFESFTPPFSTNFLQIFSKKPVIGIVNMLSGEDMKRKYKLPFEIIEKAGLKSYKYLITSSAATKKMIKKINPKAEIITIPHGVDKISKSETPSKKRHILFMGRVEVNQKGLDLLLDAYSKIIDDVGYPLYIAGIGEKKEVSKLKKTIDSLNLSHKVKLLGRITGEEKVKAYRDSLFVVIPSRFETFSLVALEAMAHRRALISFDIKGLSWVPETCRMTASPFNIKSLSQAIFKLSNNLPLSKQLGTHGQHYAQKYSWENSAKQYKEFIFTVLSKRQYG